MILSTSLSPPTILVAADGDAGAANLARRLERLGYAVAAAEASTAGAVARAVEARPSLVVMDLTLAGEPDPITAAARISQAHQAPVVFLVDGADAGRLARARLAEPYAYVFRWEDDRELKLGVETALARQRAEHRLGLCERRWLVTLQSIGDGVIVTDGLGRVSFMNPVAEQMTGWQADEALRRPAEEVFRIVHETTREPLEHPVARVLREGAVVGLDNHSLLMRRDGWEIHIDHCAAPVRDGTAMLAGTVLVFHDVTERRRQEREMRRLSRLYATMSRINQAVVRARTREELFARTCAICVEEGAFPLAWIGWTEARGESLQAVAYAGQDGGCVARLAQEAASGEGGAADGLLASALSSGVGFTTQDFRAPAWIEAAARVGFRAVGAFPLRFEGTVRGLLVVHTREHEFFRIKEIRLLEEVASDLGHALDHLEEGARRRAAEAALDASEARLEAILDQSVALIFVKDLAGRFTHANAALLRVLGQPREGVLGRTTHDLLPRETADQHVANDRQVAATGAPLTVEETHAAADGLHTYLAVKFPLLTAAGEVYAVGGIATDITASRALEAQARQDQKLAAIGTLAGGVAHEINNPINGVMNYARLILDGSGGREPLGEYAREILVESERVATIVRHLLQFARPEPAGHSRSRAADLLERTLSLIRTILKRDQIRLEVGVPDGLPLVRCRRQQIQQVLMNLLTNGRDALNARTPGYDPDKLLRVTAARFEDGGAPWVRITVEDHGTGVPPAVRERMFEPFFTTKHRTAGRGLGLAISHRIVQEHRGRLRVESEVGRFTRLHLELPAESEGEDESEDESEGRSSSGPEERRGIEHGTNTDCG